MGIQKVGDWEKVERLINNIKPEMVASKNLSLKRWGLKAEAVAKKHISMQDLNWVQLKPETLATKLRKGYSENILVQTSTYFQSITSWQDATINNTVYAGVKKQARGKDGEIIADIAATHEYGSKSGRIPARPLWQPTFDEVVRWHFASNTPEKIFAQRIKRFY